MGAPDVVLCGIDEAGRGPLAGPVYAAAVILDPQRRIHGLRDSKLIPEHKRDSVAERVRERSYAWAVAFATVEEIDQLNILQASLLAMRRAVEALAIQPDEAWIDGDRCPQLSCRTRTIVGGDRKVRAISAASVLAKTARDAEMRKLHERYPAYGFDKHKGYATAEHLEALERHGPCEIHRRTFYPVRFAQGEFPFEES